MKKLITIVLVVFVACFSMVAQARVGDVVGVALHTDIVAYINHYAIPSYAVNGQSVVVAEDLSNFGFDVNWDAYSRTLSIARNGNRTVSPMDVSKDGAPGTKFANILETDIRVYAGGRQITSYAIDGCTMIPIEELNMFGNVYWVEGERALKLWVDGLHALDSKQYVSPYVYVDYYPYSNIPSYEGVTGIQHIAAYLDGDPIHYIYPHTHCDEYAEVDDYGFWLIDHGWEYHGGENIGEDYYEYYYKDGQLIMTIIDYGSDEVWVTFSR